MSLTLGSACCEPVGDDLVGSFDRFGASSLRVGQVDSFLVQKEAWLERR
jgi:hypothetical protein